MVIYLLSILLRISLSAPMLLTTTNETISPIWDTVAGGNSNASTPGSGMGQYATDQEPKYAFDQSNNTKYQAFGSCDSKQFSYTCGNDTGLYLTLSQGASVLAAVQFETGNDTAERDPLTITIEGSNQTSPALILGSSWSLVYRGPTGLNTDPGRSNFGTIQYLPNIDVSYKSYRLLVTSIRGNATSVQYDEVKLLGY